MLTDISLLLFLIFLNGIFAMSEIAIVGSKRARLLQMAETGSAGARHALTLSSEPRASSPASRWASPASAF